MGNMWSKVADGPLFIPDIRKDIQRAMGAVGDPPIFSIMFIRDAFDTRNLIRQATYDTSS